VQIAMITSRTMASVPAPDGRTTSPSVCTIPAGRPAEKRVARIIETSRCKRFGYDGYSIETSAAGAMRTAPDFYRGHRLSFDPMHAGVARMELLFLKWRNLRDFLPV